MSTSPPASEGRSRRDEIAHRLSYLAGTTRFRLAHGSHLDLGDRVRIGHGVFMAQHPHGFLRLRLADRVRIGRYSGFQGAGELTMGEDSYCSAYCIFGVGERITIGRDVMIAERVSIRDTNHGYEDLATPMIRQPLSTDPVTIEDNVWVGAGAQILPGVTVGTGAIVAAGAIVTKDVSPNSIVGGVPATVIGQRG